MKDAFRPAYCAAPARSRSIAYEAPPDRAWLDTLPPSLENSATAEALRSICDLDLSDLESVEPRRGKLTVIVRTDHARANEGLQSLWRLGKRVGKLMTAITEATTCTLAVRPAYQKPPTPVAAFHSKSHSAGMANYARFEI